MTVFAGDEEYGDDVTSGPLDDEPGGITAMVVTAAEWDALTADRDAMVAALAAATHTYEPCCTGVACDSACDSCGAAVAVAPSAAGVLETVCCRLRVDPVHQTPDAVRARLAGGTAC